MTGGITDLVMISWTRVDPKGAIAAVAGTNDEHYAWWAWACHDPQTALDTAVAESPGRVNNVTWGIGEFHPKWLRENIDLIPESGRNNAIQGLVKWGEVDDAMATLEFLKERGSTPPKDMLKNLVRQDPWAAYDWFEKNGAAMGSYYGGQDQAMNLLIEAMADEHPQVLAQLVAEAPSGARKRKMEAAAFQNLLQLDLDAALTQAQETSAPVVGAERMAAVGMRLVRTDPDRAFEVAAQLFTKFPDALRSMTHIVFPNGGSTSSGSGSQPARQLLDSLINHDPVRVMEMHEAQLAEAPQVNGASEPEGAIGVTSIGTALGGFGNSYSSSATMADHIASRWATQDLEGFAEWVVEKNDPATTTRSAPAIIGQLRRQQRFDEAMTWAMETGENRSASLTHLFTTWHHSMPEQAIQWLEAAEVTPEERTSLERFTNAPIK